MLDLGTLNYKTSPPRDVCCCHVFCRLNSGKLFSLVCNPSTAWHAFFIDCQKTACQKLGCQYTHAFLHYLPQSRHAFLHYCLKTDMTFYRHDFLHYCQSTGQPENSLERSKWMSTLEFF